MEPLTTISPRGETHWLAQGDAIAQLIGPQGFKLADWERAGQLEIIKSGPHRTVYRVQLAAGCYFLKHYRVGDWKAVLQNIARPPRAIREWQAAQRVAAAGVPTIDTIAIGRTVCCGLTLDNFLASRAIENTLSLDEFALRRLPELTAGRRDAVRRRLADALGRLVAALHRNGLIHCDLHAENVLVRLEPDDAVRLWLIDLHAVDLYRRLTLKHIERNLALLNPALVHHVSGIDRARFFRGYWHALLSHDNSESIPPVHLAAEDRRAVSNRLAAYCRRDLLRVERKRDRKWGRGNRRLIIADDRHVRCRGVETLGRELLLAIRDDAAARLGIEELWRLPATNHWQSRSVTLDDLSRRIACRVRFVCRPTRSAWRRLRGERSKARQAWEMGHALLRRNIPTPRPLAFVDRSCGRLSQQLLMTEEVPHAVPLASWLRAEFSTHGDARHDRRLGRVAQKLASELRRLHDAGFEHSTISPSSFLVDRHRPDGQIWFVSLENVRQRHRLRRRHLVGALAELCRSVQPSACLRLTHRLRFLQCYLPEGDGGEWKRLWRDVERKCAALGCDWGEARAEPAGDRCLERPALARSA